MKKALCLFAAGAALSGAVTSSDIAEAKWTRNTPWSCALTGVSIVDTNFAPHNGSSTTPMIALCPVDDRDDFPKHTIKSVNVHVSDNNPSGSANSNALAMLCESSDATTGGSCGAQKASSFGNTVLQPTKGGTWTTNPGDGFFGYVWVSVPVTTFNGIMSNFRGYFLST